MPLEKNRNFWSNNLYLYGIKTQYRRKVFEIDFCSTEFEENIKEIGHRIFEVRICIIQTFPTYLVNPVSRRDAGILTTGKILWNAPKEGCVYSNYTGQQKKSMI